MNDMTVLIIGGGGREHALAWKLSQSPACSRLIATPGNPGIASYAECKPLNVADRVSVLHFVESEKVDLVVVGPEQPLVDGLADFLRDIGHPVFGPSKAAAQLEGSKAFSKAFMNRHSIPTAESVAFTAAQVEEALKWIDSRQ